jgi:uncharacterized integral membrane protein
MIRILIAAPFLALMVLFALSNPAPVKLGIWPTDYAIEVPLSLAILAAMGVAFFLGALLLWVSAMAARMRARGAEKEVRRLRTRIDEQKVQIEELKLRANRPMPALGASSAVPATRSLAPIP